MLCPVACTKTREIILYDIYVAGKWVGSRRTLEQAIDELWKRKWPSCVIGETVWINSDKN